MINKELLAELTNRFNIDQELIKKGFIDDYVKNCQTNSEWLKQIISKQGWLSEEKVSKQGELCAWLIIQHSNDLNFQENCLNLLKKEPKTTERKRHIAYLVDRILMKKGQPQIYGTQFVHNKLYLIKDKNKLDLRRKLMGLGPFEIYYKQIISSLSSSP